MSDPTSTTLITYIEDLCGNNYSDFLKLDVEYVFIGNQEQCTNIWKLRKEHGRLNKTFCLPLTLENCPDSTNREALQQILSESGVYGSKDFMDVDRLLWNWSLPFFIKRVAEINPFNTTHFCWISTEILKDFDSNHLNNINKSWVQNGIPVNGLRIVQTGVMNSEESYLDARNFYGCNWNLVNTRILGGNAMAINVVYERLERQKNYLLKIKKVALLRDILARISYFFKEDFDVVNTLDTLSYSSLLEVFCQERFNVKEMINSGRRFREQEYHCSAVDILGKLADVLIDEKINLDKEQTFALFYELAISSFYVRYDLYKKYTNWFKDYLKKNDYKVDGVFNMNINF